MGKKDTLTKKYLSRPDIFADAFNYFLFDGKKVIKPKDLEEQDATELTVLQKTGKLFTNQKIRDVLILVNAFSCRFLFIESCVHSLYAVCIGSYLR
ncbi:MAG: hypothetical protein IJU93_06710 [Lachnospiraceae bacterium]|nr:hypothetical protein [Lachnospiraceae bacterium]